LTIAYLNEIIAIIFNFGGFMFATTLLGFTVTTIWAVIILCIWIALAFWPARVAGRKGHSFLGYFLLSIFFFPLALILAYVVQDRNNKSTPTSPPPPPAQTTTE
jgi:amino acid transporter